MLPPPPVPPCWIAYPEPERSRLEAVYLTEHARYCSEIDSYLISTAGSFAVGILLSGAFLWWTLA